MTYDIISTVTNLLQILSTPKDILLEEAISSRLESVGKEGIETIENTADLSLEKTCKLISAINKSILKHDAKFNKVFLGKKNAKQ